MAEKTTPYARPRRQKGPWTKCQIQPVYTGGGIKGKKTHTLRKGTSEGREDHRQTNREHKKKRTVLAILTNEKNHKETLQTI